MTRGVIIPAVLLAVATLGAQQPAPEIASIKKEEMKADLFFLGGDSMRGRLTDTPENALAADWIASRFERLGLKPAGDGGTYFQKYELVTAAIGAENRLAAGPIAAKSGVDFYPTRFSGTGTATGELVFAGFGIASPERSYDDYRGDVRGKIVLVIDHEPGERDPGSPFDGIVTSQVSDPLRKALAAQEQGAAGILFVSDIHNHEAPADFARSATNYWPERAPRIPRYMLGTWVDRVRIPAAQIAPALADQMLAKSGRTLADLSKASETTKGSMPVAVPGVRVELTTAVTRTKIADRNVVAMMEGSDPALREELVIVCAHYDHDGVNGEQVLNGADDDGSGTIGVMEIAEAYALAAQKGQRPKRSVLFAAWNSEERGLFGAWAYTENPIRPLAQTVAVLNMDMIGRNEEVPEGGGGRFRGLEVQTAESNANAVNIIGTTRSASLKSVVERANSGIGLTLRLRYDNNASQLMRRSDHWPFLNTGVPAVWVHTGLHPDYHTPNDDPARINYDKMEKITRLVHQASWDLATTTVRPTLGGLSP
jgi:Zn-dependent M28 family amino/carboxypeptidase